MSVHVVVAVLTYRRPAGLADLLASLQDLIVPGGVTARVVVVDNDTAPSAELLVKSHAQGLSLDLTYLHAPEPGIPHARNRALAAADSDDFLLFVDDDETITPSLLEEHLRVQRQTGATFVQGGCTKTVADPKDAWWLDTVFFRDREFPDGSARHESWTNNVLIDMAFVKEHDVRFDPKLQFAGGSDTLFFQDIIRHGGTGAYAAHATVKETQLPSRLTWKWATARQFRYGVTRANTKLLRSSYPQALLYCAIRSVGMQVVGIGHFLTALVKGKRGIANGTALVMRGAGVAAGALGFRADEYSR